MYLNELTKKLFDITAKYGENITINTTQMSELFDSLNKHEADEQEIKKILGLKKQTKTSKIDLSTIFNKWSKFYEAYQKDDDTPFENDFIDIAGIIKCDLRYDSKIGHARFMNFLDPENKISIRLSFGMFKNVGVSVSIKDRESAFTEFLLQPENGEIFTDKSFQKRVEEVLSEQINKRNFEILLGSTRFYKRV